MKLSDPRTPWSVGKGGLCCCVFQCPPGHGATPACVNLFDRAALEADQKEKVIKTLTPETKAFVSVVRGSD